MHYCVVQCPVGGQGRIIQYWITSHSHDQSFLHLAQLTGRTNISRLYRSGRTQKRRTSLAIMSLANHLAFNGHICIKLSKTQLIAAPPLFEWPRRLPKVHCGSVNHALPLSIGSQWARRCGHCHDSGHAPLAPQTLPGAEHGNS